MLELSLTRSSIPKAERVVHMPPLIQINADEINHLIYAYLEDSGFGHTAYSLKHEARLEQSEHFNQHIPRGELVELLSKALLYVEIETHCVGDAIISNCEASFSLIYRHTCSEGATNTHINGVKADASGSPLNEKQPEPSADPAHTEQISLSEPVTRGTTPAVDHTQENPVASTDTKAPAEVLAKPAKIRTEPGPGDDTTPHEAVLMLSGYESEVFVGSWNPTVPQLLATGSKDAKVHVWNCPNPPSDPSQFAQAPTTAPLILRHLLDSPQKDITSIDWDPSGTLLATGSYDSILRVWNTSGELFMSQPLQEGPIFATRFSPSGRWLLSASLDGTACVWDVVQRSLYRQFTCHDECCLDVDWLDDSTFASCGADGLIRVVRLGHETPILTLEGHTNEVNQVKFDKSGKRLASCSDDHTARVWNLDNLSAFDQEMPPGLDMNGTGHRLNNSLILQGHKDSVGSISWCPNASSDKPRILATASFDGTARIWDADSGECLRSFQDHRRAVYTLKFSPDGKFLATGSGDGWMYIYTRSTGDQVWSWYAGGEKPGIYEVDWQQAGDINRILMCLESWAVGIVDVTRVPALR